MFHQGDRCAIRLQQTASHLHATAHRSQSCQLDAGSPTCTGYTGERVHFDFQPPCCTVGAAASATSLSETTLDFIEADVVAQTEILYDET